MAHLTTMDKWTEGPWKAEITTDLVEGMTVTISNIAPDADDDGRLQDYGCSLLEGGGLVRESDEENRANAYMMAAAPEMYDVLGKVKAAMVKAGHWRQGEYHWVSVLIDAARAAARGQEDRSLFDEDE